MSKQKQFLYGGRKKNPKNFFHPLVSFQQKTAVNNRTTNHPPATGGTIALCVECDKNNTEVLGTTYQTLERQLETIYIRTEANK